MANIFNEDGTYNKTEWKAGDKITAVKLNKIELSLEAINNNDIDRHVETDNRLDILEEQMTHVNSLIEMLIVKLNKIELSLEAINNNDIDRHVETDNRLDILEEQMTHVNSLIEMLIESGVLKS